MSERVFVASRRVLEWILHGLITVTPAGGGTESLWRSDFVLVFVSFGRKKIRLAKGVFFKDPVDVRRLVDSLAAGEERVRPVLPRGRSRPPLRIVFRKGADRE
jgi:hypothetical protein